MLRSYFKPPSPLFIASFAIFDKVLPIYCLGQQPSRTTVDNHQRLDLSALIDNKDNNGTPEKLYAITLTSNYIVTLTSTSYSYSSLTTTITGLPSSSPAVLPDNTATMPPSRSSSANSSNDTAILIGSLVGGITGVLLIGLGVFLFFCRKDRKTTLPTMDPDYDDDNGNNDYRSGKSKRISYGRAFVPPLTDAYPIDPSLSTPSVETSNPNSYHPSYYRYQDEANQSGSAEDEIRHVPDETNHALGAERYVPHLVD